MTDTVTTARLVLKLEPPWTAAAPLEGEASAFARRDLPARIHTTPLVDRFERSEDEDGAAEMRSALGWPVRVLERVVDARCRVAARYLCFELAGWVVAEGPADAREILLGAALTARPDWGGDLVCLADLFAGLSP
jgi:hypothetical protein